MTQNLLDLLGFARNEQWKGKYIDIALGKNKYPESIKEGLQQYKNGLWQK